MTFDTSRDDLSESHRHCISYLPRKVNPNHGFPRGDELKLHRKGLKQGSFANRDSPMLFWVTESAITDAQAFRSYHRTEGIPFHSPINAPERLASLLFMTSQLKMFGPVLPTSAFSG
jgi:hypothetical protein